LVFTKEIIAHLIALLTIVIWSLTFVETKVLLEYLSAEEILIDRFVLAWIIFFLLMPKLVFHNMKDELLFMALGFSGIFGYYILENLALKYTSAINVGLIVTTAPIFTTLLLIFLKKYPKRKIYISFVGFLFVVIGLLVMQYNNITPFALGDILALLGALFFGIYSLLLSKVPKNYHILIITRKSFFWGVVFLVLFFYLFGNSFASIEVYKKEVVWANLLFLAIVASGLCFLMWRYTIAIIGSSKASNYIYLVPLLNSLAAIYILDEVFSITLFFATLFILSGLFIAQKYGV